MRTGKSGMQVHYWSANVAKDFLLALLCSKTLLIVVSGMYYPVSDAVMCGRDRPQELAVKSKKGSRSCLLSDAQ